MLQIPLQDERVMRHAELVATSGNDETVAASIFKTAAKLQSSKVAKFIIYLATLSLCHFVTLFLFYFVTFFTHSIPQ
jgi:hypothetical protein